MIKIARFWPRNQATAVAESTPPVVDVDALSVFGSEGGTESPEPAHGTLVLAPRPDSPAAPVAPERPAPKLPHATALDGGHLPERRGGVGRDLGLSAVHRAPRAGPVHARNHPPGMPVTIDGQANGTTPLTLALAPGTHEVIVGTGAGQRTLHPTVAPGLSLVQRIEMTPAAQATGALRVETEAAGLPVLVDGVARGVSPLTIDALAPGDHDVVIGTEATAVHRPVSVRANETVSFFVPIARPPAVSAGWLATASPVVAQITENGRVIGSTDLDRVMLAAGEHNLVLVNEALGFRAERRVTIVGGKVARLSIDPPLGTLNINAQPWAEVWIDGQSLGQTPIGNLSTPIGSHEIIFRHPQLGERRETVVVTLQQPARIGVDMRRQ